MWGQVGGEDAGIHFNTVSNSVRTKGGAAVKLPVSQSFYFSSTPSLRMLHITAHGCNYYRRRPPALSRE